MNSIVRNKNQMNTLQFEEPIHLVSGQIQL